MPPFRTGLLKRKNSDKEANEEPAQTPEDEASDSASEAQTAPVFEYRSDESSELEDSDDDDTEEGSESDDGDDESDESVGSRESGLGETHSGSSEDHDTLQSQLMAASKKMLKKKSKSKVIITRSKSKGSRESGVDQSDGSSSDEQTQQQVDGAPSVAAGGAVGKSSHKAVGKVVGKDAGKEKSAVEQLTQQVADASVVDGRDEYSSMDTSDEEERLNTRGDVPARWYEHLPHVGYDLAGRRLIKPTQGGLIDDFLRRCEDPDFWRTVKDPSTGQDIVLSTDDLRLIDRLRKGLTPGDDDDQEWSEWFTSSVLATPVRAFPEHKRSFLPARAERLQVARLVHALRCGWRKTRRELARERKERRERRFYDLWGSGPPAGRPPPAPAPRRAPPAHAESYNPPPEYLLDAKELKEWNKLSSTPWKRKYTFLPTRHSSLRSVPAYPRYTRERFLRCLDLYLAPRATRMRLTIQPTDLVPQLPSPRDLQPFPTREVLRFEGHQGAVRSLDLDPTGRYCCSASDDHTVKLWEVSTGRCVRTWDAGAAATCVRWAPAGPGLLACAAGHTLLLLAHRPAAGALLRDIPAERGDARTEATATWLDVPAERWAGGERARLRHGADLRAVAWHARGDYLAVALRPPHHVAVHQVSRRRTQLPLSRSKGAVQDVLFHPLRPYLFVATQRVVRVYDLLTQTTLRTLRPGAQWISGLALHPAGDNLLVTTYDRKCLWFDLDLSSAPYQTLRLHGNAVRAGCFHPRYPLFATAGDDPYIVVSHGKVYNDLLQNPLLVPLKQLAGPAPRDQLCVLALRWHPRQPWLLAAGADHTLRLLA